MYNIIMFNFSQFAPQKVFLIQGDESTFESVLETFTKINPFTQAISVPRFTIEHARSIAEFTIEGTGKMRAYIVYFSAFSPEAAQVLLKSLEEPDQNTSVIFVTRYPYLVPQTVRSRMMLLRDLKKKKNESKKIILDEIKKEATEKEDDAATRRSRALDLLDQLEITLSTEQKNAKVIYEAKRMLFFANLPTKYVLDYVATLVR